MSGGAAAPVAGLGLLPGSLSVHLDGEPERRPAYLSAVGSGRLAAGWAADDCAALVFRGTVLERCVASRPGARVVFVSPDGAGRAGERRIAVELLEGAEGGSALRPESYGVSEMRALRGGRHRWD